MFCVVVRSFGFGFSSTISRGPKIEAIEMLIDARHLREYLFSVEDEMQEKELQLIKSVRIDCVGSIDRNHRQLVHHR
jgi:hypothetical protein